MSIEGMTIQMLIQGRELSLQQRGDAQKELDKFLSQQKEIEDDNEWTRTVVDRFNVANVENTKLKETIKQAHDLLHKCNSSDANVDRAIELLKQ